MIYTGGFFDGKDLITAFSQCEASRGLVYGTFFTIIFVFVLYIPRKVVSYNEFVECIPEGFKAMVPSILILVLAWSLGDLVSNQLQAGTFVYNTLQSASISTAILPACLFVVGAGLSFSTRNILGNVWYFNSYGNLFISRKFNNVSYFYCIYFSGGSLWRSYFTYL